MKYYLVDVKFPNIKMRNTERNRDILRERISKRKYHKSYKDISLSQANKVEDEYDVRSDDGYSALEKWKQTR